MQGAPKKPGDYELTLEHGIVRIARVTHIDAERNRILSSDHSWMPMGNILSHEPLPSGWVEGPPPEDHRGKVLLVAPHGGVVLFHQDGSKPGCCIAAHLLIPPYTPPQPPVPPKPEFVRVCYRRDSSSCGWGLRLLNGQWSVLWDEHGRRMCDAKDYEIEVLPEPTNV